MEFQFLLFWLIPVGLLFIATVLIVCIKCCYQGHKSTDHELERRRHDVESALPLRTQLAHADSTLEGNRARERQRIQRSDERVSHEDRQLEMQQLELQQQQERIEQQERQERREQERLREMERLERERQREYRLRNELQRDSEHRMNSSRRWNGWGIGVHINRGSTPVRISNHPNMPIRR